MIRTQNGGHMTPPPVYRRVPQRLVASKITGAIPRKRATLVREVHHRLYACPEAAVILVPDEWTTQTWNEIIAESDHKLNWVEVYNERISQRFADYGIQFAPTQFAGSQYQVGGCQYVLTSDTREIVLSALAGLTVLTMKGLQDRRLWRLYSDQFENLICYQL